jgi:hypothetical protein
MNSLSKLARRIGGAVAIAVSVVFSVPTGSSAAPISFQNGTATFSQACSGGFTPDASVNGNNASFDRGWALAKTCGGPIDDTDPHTAVWETTSNVTAAQLQFGLFQLFGGSHLIGRFRLSVTSDDRSTFADGLDTGGDVTANWLLLTGATLAASAGMTLTELGDGSILAGGATTSTGVYDVGFSGSFVDITGIRLEVLEHPSLPRDGPGLQPTNGNFVLTEFTLDASEAVTVTEPPLAVIFGLALVSCALANRRRSV